MAWVVAPASAILLARAFRNPCKEQRLGNPASRQHFLNHAPKALSLCGLPWAVTKNSICALGTWTISACASASTGMQTSILVFSEM